MKSREKSRPENCGVRAWLSRADPGFVPRFVPDSGYSENFGEQWNRFRRTQLDKFNGTRAPLQERFYSGTGWSPDELKGARVLEAGCGAGRLRRSCSMPGRRCTRST
ncbi:MAG: hypothetical protein MRJ92_12735 [Nitrospira sp.]|nr:hypothetical protein [Nitrospira sp.]